MRLGRDATNRECDVPRPCMSFDVRGQHGPHIELRFVHRQILSENNYFVHLWFVTRLMLNYSSFCHLIFGDWTFILTICSNRNMRSLYIQMSAHIAAIKKTRWKFGQFQRIANGNECLIYCKDGRTTRSRKWLHIHFGFVKNKAVALFMGRTLGAAAHKRH